MPTQSRQKSFLKAMCLSEYWADTSASGCYGANVSRSLIGLLALSLVVPGANGVVVSRTSFQNAGGTSSGGGVSVSFCILADTAQGVASGGETVVELGCVYGHAGSNFGGDNSPEFTSTPEKFAVINKLYEYQVSTSDPNDSPRTITATGKPSWLSFIDNGDGTGLLSGTPLEADLGFHGVTLEVENAEGFNVTQSFTVTATDLMSLPVRYHGWFGLGCGLLGFLLIYRRFTSRKGKETER